MAVFRVNKNKNYTHMSNYHLKDIQLSLKGKGLLSVMFSLPEEWDYSVKGLEKILKESKNTINDILNELETLGYLERKRLYFNGKISEWEYNIYETPHLHPKNQDIEIQDIENWDVNKYTKELNTKELNKEIIIKKEFFDKFWKQYPRKENKSKTEEWFKKHKVDEELFDIIIKSLDIFKKSKQWQNKQYIPYATTWLNQKRWEDNVIDKKEKEENFDDRTRRIFESN